MINELNHCVRSNVNSLGLHNLQFFDNQSAIPRIQTLLCVFTLRNKIIKRQQQQQQYHYMKIMLIFSGGHSQLGLRNNINMTEFALLQTLTFTDDRTESVHNSRQQSPNKQMTPRGVGLVQPIINEVVALEQNTVLFPSGQFLETNTHTQFTCSCLQVNVLCVYVYTQCMLSGEIGRCSQKHLNQSKQLISKQLTGARVTCDEPNEEDCLSWQSCLSCELFVPMGNRVKEKGKGERERERKSASSEQS